MLEFLKQEANMTTTENGAAAYTSTGSACLDLFASIGAIRGASGEEIINRFVRAYFENPDVAMKILFFARDIRGGLGERRVFRTIMRWLAQNKPASVRKNLGYFIEMGRYDDLFCLAGTLCEEDMIAVVKEQFEADLKALTADGNVSLLGKWMPSVNASNQDTVRLAKRIAAKLGYKDAQYRKTLTALRARINIIENSLREMDYTFDYEKQPSRAMYKYRNAFLRNDKERYDAFLCAVSNGEAKLHADNVAPYELVQRVVSTRYYSRNQDTRMYDFLCSFPKNEEDALNAAWASLPDFAAQKNALAIVDTSGSMYGESNPSAAAVALSLGIYCAEHSKGMFANHFIEFSAYPQLIEMKGETFCDKVRYMASFNQIANTNLEAVFDLILSAAVKNHVQQEELPSQLIIISDMEFDCCMDNTYDTVFENAKEKYAGFGYALPNIVFWNAASRNRQQPVKMNEQGAVLVSGVTPRLFEMIAGGQTSPYAFMMEVINAERYAGIAA